MFMFHIALSQNQHFWKDLAVEAVTAASIAHSLLPPWDWDPDFVKTGLAEFPRAQRTFRAAFNNRWYRLFVYTVGYIALNARSTVWRSISVKNLTASSAGKEGKVIGGDTGPNGGSRA